MTEQEITQLAFEISKNDLKIKLNDIYLDILGEAFNIIDDNEKFNNFKKEIKAEIIVLSYLEISKAVNFNEAIHIFNNSLEKMHKLLEDICPIEKHYQNFSYPYEDDNMKFADSNGFSLDLSNENLIYLNSKDITEDKKMYIDPTEKLD